MWIVRRSRMARPVKVLREMAKRGLGVTGIDPMVRHEAIHVAVHATDDYVLASHRRAALSATASSTG